MLEAKREDKSPLNGKEQARSYAHSQNARFIILSNGNLHYFWDLERGNPEVITEFPTSESIKHRQAFKPNPKKLAEEIVKDDYIAISQNPTFKTDPRWIDEAQRESFISDQGLRILRKYQLEAIHTLQDRAANPRRQRRDGPTRSGSPEGPPVRVANSASGPRELPQLRW